MLFPDRIDYKIAGDDFELPRMFMAKQVFSDTHIADIPAAVRKAVESLKLPDLRGLRIALTAGSRGVANQALILRTVIDILKEMGAKPFIVPGMGSHGGATAEGQLEVIHGYGVTEEAMGVPILASMDVVRLGETATGFPVYCDRHAFEADYILPVHRVKPHTDFKAEIESGICKMLVIGLGKHRGASHIHSLGFPKFDKIIPEAAQVFIDSGKIIGSVGVVENAFDETMIIEGMRPAAIVSREKELLVQAKNAMPRFYMDGIDVLLVEEIGKNISGSGMDPNITGRPGLWLPGFETTCPINRIIVMGISALSHGNATGLGGADLVTVDFMKQADLGSTYINGITARGLESSKIPLVANNDREALQVALFCCFGLDPANIRIAQITNTLLLSTILLSEAYLPQIKNDPRFEILSEPEAMRFDANGRLARLQ